MDFKDTIFLPKTDFQMKANLSKKEPEILDFWNNLNIYKKLRDASQNCEKYVVHDGPPFANGTPHAGTAMNKVLKDIVVKMKQMQGYNSPFVPGWDCHGLPIEWKVEENLKSKGQTKDSIPVSDFRNLCKEFAEYWIGIQKQGFKRLGVVGDWDNPYLTMNKESESIVIKQLGKLLIDGSIYRGEKPVFWSVVEQTALAEAEIEYMDKKSTSIYVAFPVKMQNQNANQDFLHHAKCIIWTTTPWTLPGNRAISYNKNFTYNLIESEGSKFIIAKDLTESFAKTIEKEIKILCEFQGDVLENLVCTHPLYKDGYDFDVPLIHAEHVTIDAGTGLVHTAPGHGIDDFEVCKSHNIGVPKTVNEAGIYYESVPLFAGQHIFKAEKSILDALKAVNALIHQSTILHSYPHSWRSKAPLIYRTTPQWFLSLDKTGIRKKTIIEIEKTKWLPEQGYNRINSFVINRGDWCLSRQRVWGIPLPIFISKATGEPLKDMDVINRIAEIFAIEGSNAWFNRDAQDFLGEKYISSDYVQSKDTADVWFESSSSHAYVLATRKELKHCADLYLEGSDQHRGWFQHSLLVSCAINNAAPFKSVMTHGFIVDENGRKMSKSLGNTVTLDDIVEKYGADIFRMWVASVDFTQDLKLGKNILAQLEDVYRKIRNTFKYMLGALNGYDKSSECVEYRDLPDLEKWILHSIYVLNIELMKCINSYDINKYFSLLYTFCVNELSSFFFDIRKDCLYCDAQNDVKRKSYRYVLTIIFEYVVKWLAPIISFTSEEAWGNMHNNNNNGINVCDTQASVHLELFSHPDKQWVNKELYDTIEKIRNYRRSITTAIEIARKNKILGSSLQAKVIIYDPKKSMPMSFDCEFWNELAIVSDFEIRNTSCIPNDAFIHDDIKDIGVIVELATGEKCERCWKISKHLNESKLCSRCQKVLAQK